MKTSLKTQNARIANAMSAKSMPAKTLSAKAANGKSAPAVKTTRPPKAKPITPPAESTDEPTTKKHTAPRAGKPTAKAPVPAPVPNETPFDSVTVVETPVVDSLSAPVTETAPDKATEIAQQIVIRAGALKAALKQVVRARAKGSSLPVLSHILVETIDQDALRFTATDLDFALWHLSAAKVLKHGAVCLPDILSDLLAKVNDDLLVTLTTNKKTWVTKVEAGRLTTRLKAMDPAEFPPAVSYNGKSTFIGVDLTHESVTEITKRIVPFASSDDSRPILMGVHVRGNCPKESGKNTTLRFASADGYRLSILERDVTLRYDPAHSSPETLDVIVPARVFAETLKVTTDDAKPIQFLFHLQHDKQGVLERGMVQVETHAGGLRMNLLAGTFPDFGKIIPNPIPPLPSMPLAVEAALGALSRASLISPTNIAKFAVESEHIRVSASSDETGDSVEVIPAHFDTDHQPAPNFEIAFNAGFLSDAIRAAAYGDGAKPVQLRVDKSSTPAYITLPRFVHVLMPMHIGRSETETAPAKPITSAENEPKPLSDKKQAKDAPKGKGNRATKSNKPGKASKPNFKATAKSK